jgi:hypothetical protein
MRDETGSSLCCRSSNRCQPRALSQRDVGDRC